MTKGRFNLHAHKIQGNHVHQDVGEPNVKEHGREEPPPFPLLNQRVELGPKGNQHVDVGAPTVKRHCPVDQNHDHNQSDRHEGILIEPAQSIFNLRHYAASSLF